METIKTKISVGSDRHLSLQLPQDLPPGDYEVLVVLAQANQSESPTPTPLDLAWEKWVREVQTMPLLEPPQNASSESDEYETYLLEKYRNQGLEL